MVVRGDPEGDLSPAVFLDLPQNPVVRKGLRDLRNQRNQREVERDLRDLRDLNEVVRNYTPCKSMHYAL
jgi:hypothetical protein